MPPEDALAFFRDEAAFRNVRFVEPDNGDFAVTIARLLVFSTYRLALLQRLATSRDPVLAAIAAKGVKEVTYHRDYAGRWFLTLARGTEESRRRLLAGAARWSGRCTTSCSAPTRSSGPSPSRASASTRRSLADEVDVLLEQVLSVSGVDRPDVPPTGAGRRRHGPRRPAHRGDGPAARRDAGRRPRPPDRGVVRR